MWLDLDCYAIINGGTTKDVNQKCCSRAASLLIRYSIIIMLNSHVSLYSVLIYFSSYETYFTMFFKKNNILYRKNKYNRNCFVFKYCIKVISAKQCIFDCQHSRRHYNMYIIYIISCMCMYFAVGGNKNKRYKIICEKINFILPIHNGHR